MTDQKTLGKPWLIWLGITLLSQIYFLIQVLFFFDVLDRPPYWVRVLTYEEWNWIVQNHGTYRDLSSAELDGLERLSVVLIIFFAAVITLGYVYLLSSRGRRETVGTQFLIYGFACGILVSAACFFYNKYLAVHYRMFMSFIPIAVFSFVLMIFLLRLGYRAKHLTREVGC